MAKGKVEKTGSGNWGSFGGNTKMHSWSGTGPQTPGQSSQEGNGGKTGVAAKGGNTHGFYSSGATNKFGAGPQEPGCSAQSGARQEGFAHGGKTHMFGNRGSQKATPGQSGPS